MKLPLASRGVKVEGVLMALNNTEPKPLSFNPSHLEAVNTVVLGKVRAKQVIAGNTEEAKKKHMPILLHGHMLHLIMNLLGTLNVGLNAELNWGIALNSNTEQGEGHAQQYERDLEGSFRWSTRNGRN